MLRAGAYVREPHFVEQNADVALMIFNPKTRFNHTLKINPPPPHHAVRFRIRSRLNNLLQLLQLRFSQP